METITSSEKSPFRVCHICGESSYGYFSDHVRPTKYNQNWYYSHEKCLVKYLANRPEKQMRVIDTRKLSLFKKRLRVIIRIARRLWDERG